MRIGDTPIRQAAPVAQRTVSAERPAPPPQQTPPQAANRTGATNTAQLIQKTDNRLEPSPNSVPNPDYNKSPAQINRSFEIRKDLPTAVLKFTNEVSKQVELQIPTEVQIGIYKDMQKFIAAQDSQKKDTINIRV